MSSLPSPAAAIDAASSDKPAADSGSHPDADEEAGSPPAGDDQDDEAAPAKAAQPRDKTPRDKQPQRLEGASDDDEEALPSGDDDKKPDDKKAESAFDKMLARFNGDKDKAAAAFFENDTKLAKLAKPKDDGDAADAIEEEPAPAAIDDAQIEERVSQDLKDYSESDPECTSWRQMFAENQTRIDEILKFEKRAGQMVPTGGELVTLERRIQTLQSLLDPKAAGLETIRELDEVEKGEYEDELKDAKRQRKMLVLERGQLARDNEDTRRLWHGRLEKRAADVRGHLLSTTEQQRAAESESDAEAEFMTDWKAEFVKVTQDLPKERRAEARRELLAAAGAVFDSEGDIPKVGPWMERQVKQLRTRWDRNAGQDDLRTAKDQERVTRQPAPRGPAADAQPDKTRHANPRESRRAAERRAAAFARGGGARA
jgi:hypothetical protein